MVVSAIQSHNQYIHTVKADQLQHLLRSIQKQSLSITVIAPYLAKPTSHQDSYLLVCTNQYEQHQLLIFNSFAMLQQHDMAIMSQGYRIKDVQLSAKQKEGVALWHFDTIVDLKIQLSQPSKFKLFSSETCGVKMLNSESLIAFHFEMQRLKQNHTLIGVSVSSSQLNLQTGKQQGLRVQSMWVKDCPRLFHCYYGLTIRKFIEQAEELEANNYFIHDVSVYLNQLDEVHVAAVWLDQPPFKERVVKMPNTTDSLELRIYKQLMIPFQIPSVQLVITRHNQVVVNQAFGFSNLEQNVLASTTHFTRIASVSKVFTKAAITRLVIEGKLQYSTKVFPEILGINQPGADLVTLAHLLDHTAGLWPTTTREIDPMFYSTADNHEQLIKEVLSESKFDRVGLDYVYSNFGYCVLGRVIEAVVKMSYIEYLRKTFNVDVRLGGSTFEALLQNETVYYHDQPSVCYNMNLERMDSCAGLIISPLELVRFANSLSQSEYGQVEQRGSLDGCECLLIRRGAFTMALCCNKRKSYNFKLPLEFILNQLLTQL